MISYDLSLYMKSLLLSKSSILHVFLFLLHKQPSCLFNCSVWELVYCTQSYSVIRSQKRVSERRVVCTWLKCPKTSLQNEEAQLYNIKHCSSAETKTRCVTKSINISISLMYIMFVYVTEVKKSLKVCVPHTDVFEGNKIPIMKEWSIVLHSDHDSFLCRVHTVRISQ